MASSASQRTIPPDIVYEVGTLPAGFDEGAALPIDKPRGITSFDAVKAVRKATDRKKVGHAGTLDPMATGLLIVLVARAATRLQEAFMHLPKVYKGTMRLGEVTPSHDAETEVRERKDVSHVTIEDLVSVREQFIGTIEQIPPMYSAVKIDGERLYKKARRGETVERPPRQVRVDSFDVVEWARPELQFRIECSKGTYIRSIARDIGTVLGVGAHLTSLRRVAIGPYSVVSSWSLEALRTALLNTKTDDA